jgi:hypothetical protein
MTKKEDIDERLVRWNEIFSDLKVDAHDLIQDINDMINYVFISAALLIMMGLAAVLIALLRHLEPKYLAMSVIIFSITAGNAYQIIRKWSKLRIRYDKLSSLDEEIGVG